MWRHMVHIFINIIMCVVYVSLLVVFKIQQSNCFLYNPIKLRMKVSRHVTVINFDRIVGLKRTINTQT